jgi:RNA polymerase subunit RPABC4/transcription elongation factor Spt4
MDPIINLNALGEYFVYMSAFLGAFLAALWLSLVYWTFRDIRSRSRDRVLRILAVLLVALLTLPGLLLYLILRPRDTLDDAYQKTLEEEALLSEIASRKVCPGCGSAVRGDWQVCPQCHTRIHKVCAQCGKLLELPWQICPFCATPTPGSPHTIIELDEETPSPSTDQADNSDVLQETEYETTEEI